MNFPWFKHSKQRRNKFSGVFNLPISLVGIVPFVLHIFATICLIEYFLVPRDRIITQNAIAPASIKSDRVFSRLDNYLDDSNVPQESDRNSIKDLNNFLQQLRSDVPELTEIIIQNQNGSIVTEVSDGDRLQLDSSVVERKIVRQIPIDNSRDWLVTVAMQTSVSTANNAGKLNFRLQYLSYLLPTTILGIVACIWLERSLNSARTTEDRDIVSNKDGGNSEIAASIALSQLQRELKSKQLNNYVKSSLVADMSHELRSPLNAILGFTQIMQQESTIERSQQENLAIINSSGERLLLIINELVDLSRIEVGRFSLENHNFDFHRWLDNLEQILNQNCEQLFSLIKEPNVPQYICLDESRLRQILNNLIEYCSRSSKGESQIKLNISATSTLLDLVTSPYYYNLCFEIENSSLLISDEELAGLFNPSVRARQQWQSFQGSSLSLAISYKLAQLMGGDISVIRREGSGTVFRLNIRAGSAIESDLPFKPPTLRKIVGLESEQPDYRILVVDDSRTNRKIMLHLLERVGFQVNEAVNGREAVDVWLRWQPHMIWMDLKMPVMNGYEATERIKSRSLDRSPKIVALTASTLEEERAQYSASKYDDFVGKPFSENIIFDKIAQHLGVRYIYDTSQPEKVQFQSTANIKVMPPQWLARAEQAAASLDADLLTTLLEQIPAEHSDLKRVLQKQVDNFDFEKIINSIEQSQTNR